MGCSRTSYYISRRNVLIRTAPIIAAEPQLLAELQQLAVEGEGGCISSRASAEKLKTILGSVTGRRLK